MSNPNDVEIIIPEGERVQHNGECIEGPATIKVNKYAAKKFFDKVYEKPQIDRCCFPRLCKIGDAWPTGSYRDQVTVPPGEEVIAAVPNFDGCVPSQVWFNKCGGCIYVDYDKPVNQAANVFDGSASSLNPTLSYLLDEDGACIEEIHLFNPGTENVVVSLDYFC